MSEILEWREKIQKLYARYSIYIDRVIQFLVAMITFMIINKNIGLMKSVAVPMISFVVALICTVLPPIFTVVAAVILLLLHLHALSMGIMMVSAMILLFMFIFYCRFTPKSAWILLLVPLTFFLNVPYVVPIALGLYMSPIAAIPLVFGTIIFYMLNAVKTSITAISGAGGITNQVTLFLNAVFKNKEMWVMSVAAILCVCVVYFIRRMSIDHAWKIATAAGAVTNIIVAVIGDVLFDIHISYVWLILGNLIAIAIGFVMELFFFSVDYARTEYLQYEDDEYYYYVKAVPKITISEPEKKIKRINKRVNLKRNGSSDKQTDEDTVQDYSADDVMGTENPEVKPGEDTISRSLAEELNLDEIVKRQSENE